MTLLKVVTTAPEWICLQVSDTEYDQEQPFPDDHEGITWCQDSVMPCEVAYIRADLAESRLAAADAEIERLRQGLMMREGEVSEALFRASRAETSLANANALLKESDPYGFGNSRDLSARIVAHFATLLRTGNTEAK